MLEISKIAVPKRLNNISVILEAEKLHGLTGPNGSGKSTLLKVIAGLIPTSAGTVHFNGQNLAKLDRRSLSKLITYVPQSFNMPYPYTVAEMIAMGLYASQGSSIIIDACLERVDASQFKDVPFTDLSTGEKQRILIARSLATQCPILLFDEPTANLDLRFQRLIWELIESLVKDRYTVLVASHDLEQIRQKCDQCLILDNGRLITYGPSKVALMELEKVY